MTKRGCHIGDVAPSHELNKLVDGFLDIERLEMSPGYARFQERILDDSGLILESSETVLAMRTLLAEWRKFRENKA